MNVGQPLAKGNTAELYRQGNQIIKLFHARFAAAAAADEAAKQKLVYAQGFPVPQILDVTVMNGRQAVVMEYIKGPTLGDLLQRDAEQAEQLLALSVDLQISMHATVITGLEPMQNKLSCQLKAAAALAVRAD